MAFTQEQLAAATQLPLIVMQGVITVDGTTYMSVMREFMAIGNFVDEAQVAYANNLLVQAALLQFVDESGNIDTGLQSEKVEFIPVEDVLASVDEAMQWLAGLPELPGYKHFILTLAQRIAAAAGNTLLGTGAKISAEEDYLLRALQQQLGL
jgi:hypothetical protein